jgi:hypothetical protein
MGKWIDAREKAKGNRVKCWVERVRGRERDAMDIQGTRDNG